MTVYSLLLVVVLHITHGLMDVFCFKLLKPSGRTEVNQVTSAAQLSLWGFAELHQQLTMSCNYRRKISIEPRISLKRLAEVGVFLMKTLKK